MSDFDHHDWDGAPPEGVPDWASVRVDLRDVRGFGDVVHGELVDNFHPYAEDVVRLCDDDAVAFGNRQAFPALYEARETYHAGLMQAIANVREFAAASQILVDAADRIVAGYASSDNVSADAVGTILDNAVRQVAQLRKAHDTMVEIASAHIELPTSVTTWGDPL